MQFSETGKQSARVSKFRSSDIRALPRSEPKTGLDGNLRKGGAGPHNWGSVRDELELERQALEDAELDKAELADVPAGVNGAVRSGYAIPEGKDTNLSEDEVLKAREVREKGLNEEGELRN